MSKWTGTAKYANGNYKGQQKAYNKTGKGKELIHNAQQLVKKLTNDGKSKPGPGYQAAHFKGSKTKGRWQLRRQNARSRLKNA